LSNEPGQAYGPEINQRNAPSPIEDSEDGVTRRHTQVAKQSEFQSASHGIPLDGSDHGFAKHHPGWSHRARAGLHHLRATAFSYFAKIGPGAKRALGPGKHGDMQIGIALKRLKSSGESLRCCRVNRIPRLRAVHDDGQDFVVSFDEQ
jgi:hypothetical protein